MNNGGLDSKYTRKRKLLVAIFKCQNRNFDEKVDCSHHIKFFHISSPSGEKYLKRDEKEWFTPTRFPEVLLVQTSHFWAQIDREKILELRPNKVFHNLFPIHIEKEEFRVNESDHYNLV